MGITQYHNHSVVVEKSREFAVRIVRLYQYLCKEKQEYVLSRQLLRSGTSIGANIAEAQCSISRKEFLSKVYIAYKESNETLYWLDLLHDTDYLSDIQYQSIYADGQALCKILTSITRTVRRDAFD